MPGSEYCWHGVYSRPSWLSTGTPVRGRLDGQVRVLVRDDGAISLVYRLRYRDQRERGLDVSAGLDAPPRNAHRHVLAALEVLVADRRVHRHADPRRPVDVVGPLP